MEIDVFVFLHRGNKFLPFAFEKRVLRSSVLLLTQIDVFFGEVCEGRICVFLPPAHGLQVSLEELVEVAYDHIKQNISASNVVTELFSSFTAS